MKRDRLDLYIYKIIENDIEYDIEEIKTLSITKVINHTTNVTHVYNGKTWIKQN